MPKLTSADIQARDEYDRVTIAAWRVYKDAVQQALEQLTRELARIAKAPKEE